MYHPRNVFVVWPLRGLDARTTRRVHRRWHFFCHDRQKITRRPTKITEFLMSMTHIAHHPSKHVDTSMVITFHYEVQRFALGVSIVQPRPTARDPTHMIPLNPRTAGYPPVPTPRHPPATYPGRVQTRSMPLASDPPGVRTRPHPLANDVSRVQTRPMPLASDPRGFRPPGLFLWNSATRGSGPRPCHSQVIHRGSGPGRPHLQATPSRVRTRPPIA
jgi:hypothetical protein